MKSKKELNCKTCWHFNKNYVSNCAVCSHPFQDCIYNDLRYYKKIIKL